MTDLIENRAQRVQLLKEIIGRLHNGARPEGVKGKLRALIGSATHTEIMAMEQELMAEGMPAEALQGLCDLHSQVVREVLVQLPRPVAPGHPVDTFRRENEAIRGVLGRMRAAITEIAGLQDGADGSSALLNCRQTFNDLIATLRLVLDRATNGVSTPRLAHGWGGRLLHGSASHGEPRPATIARDLYDAPGRPHLRRCR
jgi:DUF438 domain-containing protein